MRKGLLAEWRRRIVTRGLAGAALFAVPVAVAAAIGFGSSLSGVAGGLSSIANGPNQTSNRGQAGQARLTRAVVALGATPAGGGTTGGGGANGGGSQGGGKGITGSPGSGVGSTPTGGTTGGGGGDGGGDTGSSGSPNAPGVVDIPAVPAPDPGSGTGAINNIVNGVNSTVNGLIGGGQ
jgi:hypothetical protein